ncbi:LuxR C-terminal-related transcriptional regulator [Piscinibacter sp. XHJ-5]|uniref:LuxR C-terminal-related transcriptional regulator n=1 Tax=Piscinibacter sp. XHJ-5 TaxID=3037797 RepID=UPI002452E969|nr:LuxR C-terminal-related transcriptional regulator [Piscinibacter sp. XHJ-5]
MDTTFALTQIQPPRRRSAQIARPRLDDSLSQALMSRRLVLLVAAAGFGKTSALAAQIERLPHGTALAWVSLDEGDDSRRLLAGLVAALEPHDLPWRTDPQALLAQVGDEGPGVKRAVAELVNALAGADCPHGVIVVDDLHRALPPVAELLDAMIERLPPQWTVAIATRVEPALALPRLRAAGELAELHLDDLRFDADESGRFAAALAGTETSAPGGPQLAELIERTQGWPAGLRLCLAASRTRAGGLSARRGPLDRAVFDYLASEVLDDMPAPLHDFLVRCSVLPALTAARAAAVSGDAAAAERLEEVERRGLFATALDAQERTLVLHDLFREALAHRLERDLPDELPTLLQRAAASEPDAMRRVAFLLRAGDWAAAEATLVEVSDELVLQGASAELQRAAQQFPPDWRDRSARLQRLQGLAACQRWRWAEMAAHMEGAAAASRDEGDVEGQQLAQAYLASAYHALGRSDHVRALLDELEPQPLSREARVIALVGECSWHFQRGDHDAVPPLFARLVDELEGTQSLLTWWKGAPGMTWATLRGIRPVLQRYFAGALRRIGERALPLRALIHIQQAYAHLWAGRVPDALAEAAIAESDVRWLACSADIETNVTVFRTLADAMHGRAAAVEHALAELIVREDNASSAERRQVWRHQVATFAVRLTDVLGSDAAALTRWGAELADRPLEQPGRVSGIRARLAAAQGQWDDAASLFTELLAQASRMDLMGQAIELHLRTGHALLQCGRIGEAADALHPALARLIAEGEHGHALMAGPAVLAALARARWGEQLPQAQQSVLRELATLAAGLRAQAPSSSPSPSLLTVREQEVLGRIAAGDSNKAIARAFDLSPHTVKRHVANILDKLAVQSRGQAAAWHRARMQP